MFGALIGTALFVGQIAAFIYVLTSLAALKEGQAKMLEQLRRIERPGKSRDEER